MSSFTYDWFTPQVPVLDVHVPRVLGKVLEVGCFEGRSTLWFLERDVECEVTVIDHFRGGADHAGLALGDVYNRFKSNVAQHMPRVKMLIGNTWDVWPAVDNEAYDFVYVDGSHRRGDVLYDAVNALRVCKVGGVIAFDDYEWGQPGEDRPHEAISFWLDTYKRCLEPVNIEYHAIVRKICSQY